ncbi:MAG TPA: tetratricopeptide repeat protein, partial [Polyangiales bacterium]|nr:tetratricopeptide repeat protein [Polyangiales bacterium]
AELELDVRARERLYVRLAELYEHKLDNSEAAIQARQKSLELDDRNADALLALEGLYERARRFPELVDILQRRMQVAEAEDERRTLARRIAVTYEEKLGDSEKAIEAYREVQSSFGQDVETLGALSRLYEAASNYPDLLEVLEAEAALATNAKARAALRFRMAEVQREKLNEIEQAIGTYEVVLEDDPEHAGALGALDTIMRGSDTQQRKDSARVAAPRYEALGMFDKLLGVLELLAEDEDELEKLDALRRAATVAERGQNDPAAAMVYVGRALRVAHSHDSLGELLGEYGRLADQTGRFADYVATLEEIAPQIFDIEQKVRVYRRVAEVAREKLNDTALARASFRRVLEEQPEDMPSLDALLALDEEAGDHAALIDVLKRKTELTSAPAQRAELLMRQADVFERGAGEPDKAIEALEQLVSETPLPAAYAGLERLYQRTLRWSDLAALYEGQLDRGVGDPVELRYKLAYNSRSHLSDTHAALEQLREAINRDPRHPDSITLLESIMGEHGEHRAVAAEILEPGYLARMEWAKLTGALRARVDAEPDLEERKRLLVRLGRIYEEQLEDFDETIEIYARMFREDPRDEEAWETLSRLAKLGGHWSRLAKILGEVFADAPVEDPVMAKLARYVGSLYDERIVNLVKSAEYYAKALEFDREDREAFVALESAYQRAGNHAALVELYTTQSGVAANDAERVSLLHKRAKIYSEELIDRNKAVETYREILEIDPDDAAAVAGLEARLAEADDHVALAEHLRRRIEHSVGTPEENTLKHRLAELLWEKLNDESGAIDLFDEITQSDPKHPAAMLSLERIVVEERHRLRVTEILEPVYRSLDQWKKQIAIYEARLPLLTDTSEAVRLLGEIAQLHEQRGKDLAKAFNAYARAFTVEPDNDATRGHIDRIASRANAWDEHVAAYEAALAKTSDDAVKASLLTTIARVHDEKRGDPRAAIQAYERLLALEQDEPSTLDALESLYTMVGDWRGLITVIELKVKSAFDAMERADGLRRVGSVLEELLGDRDGAVTAYKRAVEEVDTDELALEALDRLYESMPKYQELAAILTRRIELASDGALRVELGLRLGALYEDNLHRAEEAIEAYRKVLDDDAENATAIAKLAQLYERQGLWQDLLDNLRTQISLATDVGERVRLYCRAGKVLQSELADVPEAIEQYRQALLLDARCDEAIGALMALTVKEDHRALAAEVVEPLLREQERWDDLVKLIERRVESILDPIERRMELVRLAEIHEHGRSSTGDAYGAFKRALADEPTDTSVQDELERLARSLGVFTDVYSVFMQRASGISDPADAAALYRRAGRVAEQELHDDARAIDAFVQASQRDDDAPETLLALDRLYVQTQRWQELVDVLERRIAALTSPSERAELLIRLGEVRDAHFDDGRGAYVAYHEVLENDPGDARAIAGMQRLGQRDDLARDVLDVLDRCFRETNALDKLVLLYDIKIRLAPTDADKIRLLQEAARIWESDLGDKKNALVSLRRAFEIDSRNAALLDELERLAQEANAWPELASLADHMISGPGSTVDGAHRREVLMRVAG